MSFDGQVVRPSQEIRELYDDYVPVRVVDMRGVDLNRYVFDWDLTFAALAMHPDGTIFHRYGGRDHRDPNLWLSEASFADFVRAGVAAHETYELDPRPRLPLPRLAIEEVPNYAAKDDGACIHCHVINPALRTDALERERWRQADLWVHPAPGRIGLDLDRDDQRRVTAVADGSPAARAGVTVGDRLASFAGRPLATASDLMAALHRVEPSGARPSLVVERGGERRDLTLELRRGWKKDTPLGFSWRSFKWGLVPAPGFGGPLLGAGEKRELGLDEEAFAFRVQYLVTWGENRRYGMVVQRAGLREGMVVLGTDTKRDFASVAHFHAWWRLTREPGTTVEVIVWEDRKERALPVRVLE